MHDFVFGSVHIGLSVCICVCVPKGKRSKGFICGNNLGPMFEGNDPCDWYLEVQKV